MSTDGSPSSFNFDDLLTAQIRDIEKADEEFRQRMAAQSSQYQSAIADRLKAPVPTSPEVSEIISLISSVPKIAPSVLKYTKELLARIQSVVDKELQS